MSALDALVAAAAEARDVESELRTLRAIKQWALGSLHVKDGDAVVLTVPVSTNNGWAPYREVLVVGSTGVVNEPWLASNGKWCGYFTPDVCWSVSNYPHRETRYTTSPTPCFMIALEKLRRRKDSDVGLLLPNDVLVRS
jgi:hypothetical protein